MKRYWWIVALFGTIFVGIFVIRNVVSRSNKEATERAYLRKQVDTLTASTYDGLNPKERWEKRFKALDELQAKGLPFLTDLLSTNSSKHTELVGIIYDVGKYLGLKSNKFDSDSDNALLVFKYLEKRAAPAIPALNNLIVHTQSVSRAFEALEAIGQPALPALTNLLHNSNKEIRMEALFTVVKISPISSDSGKQTCMAMLEDSEPVVRCLALNLILVAGNATLARQELDLISRRLSDSDLSVRQTATQVVRMATMQLF